MNDLGDVFEVLSEAGDVVAVRTALQAAGIDYDSAEATFVPSMSVPVDADVARKVALSGGGNVLVVTHSFVIRSTMYLLDPARVNDPVKIENASVTKVTCDDGFACETGAFSSALFTLGVTGSTSFLGSRL